MLGICVLRCKGIFEVEDVPQQVVELLSFNLRSENLRILGPKSVNDDLLQIFFERRRKVNLIALLWTELGKIQNSVQSLEVRTCRSVLDALAKRFK